MMPPAEILGNFVAENLRELDRELKEVRHRLTALLDTVGRPGCCTNCGANVYWISRRGFLSEMPVEHDGKWHSCRPREESHG